MAPGFTKPPGLQGSKPQPRLSLHRGTRCPVWSKSWRHPRTAVTVVTGRTGAIVTGPKTDGGFLGLHWQVLILGGLQNWRDWTVTNLMGSSQWHSSECLMKTLGFSSVLAHMNSMDHIYNPFIADLFVGNPNPHHIFLHTWVSFNKAQFLSLRAHKSLLISGWWFETFVFSIYWECHHPNWLSYFSEGWLNHQPVICFLHLSMKRACVRIQPIPTSIPVFPEGWKEPIWIYLKIGHQQKKYIHIVYHHVFLVNLWNHHFIHRPSTPFPDQSIDIDWYWCHEDHHVLLAESRLYINGVDEFWSRSGVESLSPTVASEWQFSKPFTWHKFWEILMAFGQDGPTLPVSS